MNAASKKKRKEIRIGKIAVLEYGDVVINLGSVLLGDTFGNPDNVTAFLLLELQV